MQTKKDEMTDVNVTTATTRILGENADLELAVGCGSKGGMAYHFRTFDKSGDPIDVSLSPNLDGPHKQIAIRLDGEQPGRGVDLGSPFTNEVLLLRAHRYARAQKLVARIPLANGTETYTIDQGDDSFRAAVKPCLDLETAQRQSVSERNVSQPSVTEEPSPEPTLTKAECWTPPSGPTVTDASERGMNFDEVQEIEQVTGRSYVEGDSIYGRAEDRCPS